MLAYRSLLHIWSLWLHHCWKALCCLHSTIFTTKTFLRFSVKHWQNKMLNHLSCQLRCNLIDRNVIICFRPCLCHRLSTASYVRIWERRKFVEVDITILIKVSLTSWVRLHNQIIYSDMLFCYLIYPRKWSLSLRIYVFGALGMHLNDSSLVLWCRNNSLLL